MYGNNASEAPVIRVKDKDFYLSLPNSSIQEAVASTARRISEDYNGKSPVFVVVLNGAFMFASDLVRRIEVPCEVSFVKLASYEGTGSTGKVRQLIGLNEELEGRDVIIVEDIVDTGLSMEFLLEEVERYDPSSVRIATLLFKPEAFIKDYEIHYIGLSIPNDFIVGYGLDYDGQGRNLPDIYTVKD